MVGLPKELQGKRLSANTVEDAVGDVTAVTCESYELSVQLKQALAAAC